MTRPDSPRLEEERRDAQKLAAIGRLANVVAHDFNNLLTVISAYADLALLDPTLAGKQRARMQSIRGAAESAAWLSRQLLIHSRRNKGIADAVDLNVALRPVELLLRRVLPVQVKVELHLQETLPSVTADPGLIDELLLDVVTNAMETLADGAVMRIETVTDGVDPAASAIAGPDEVVAGAPVMLRVVALPGASADAPARPNESTGGQEMAVVAERESPILDDQGLTLEAANEIMRSLGGRMDVRRDASTGLCIELHFPGATAPRASAERTAPRLSLPTGTTVLLVDGHDGVRQSMTEMLEELRCTVLTASDGGEALRTVRERVEPVHVVVSDSTLRDMSSAQLAALLSLERPAPRLLVVSGRVDASPDGSTAFLSKPFAIAELSSALLRLLQPGAPSAPAGLAAAPGHST